MAKKPQIKPRELALLSTDKAIQCFKEYATRWQGASIGLVAMGAVCLIVALRSKAKAEFSQTVLKLKLEVAETTGTKEAMIYKYVGLAKALAEHLNKLWPEAPMQELLSVTSGDKAVEIVVQWAQDQGVTSLDALGELVGKYRRTEVPENAAEASGERDLTTPLPTLPALPIAPTKAAPAAIAARIVSEPAVLNTLSASDLVSSYLKAGHKPVELIEALVPYLSTLRETQRVLKRVTTKLEAIQSRAMDKMKEPA